MTMEKLLNMLGIVGSTSVIAVALAMTPVHLNFTLEDGLSASPSTALADGDGGDGGDGDGDNGDGEDDDGDGDGDNGDADNDSADDTTSGTKS